MQIKIQSIQIELEVHHVNCMLIAKESSREVHEHNADDINAYLPNRLFGINQ